MNLQTLYQKHSESKLDLTSVQATLVDYLLLPALKKRNYKFGYVPSPTLKDELNGLFVQAIQTSDLPAQLKISMNQFIKEINFEYCYSLAVTQHLHDYLYKHFEQAIRSDPSLIHRKGHESQARTHLILASTRWYVDFLGDAACVMECLQEVQRIYHEAEEAYLKRETRH